MEWYAMIHDFNTDELKYINVLAGLDVKKIKKLKTYDEIKKEIKSYLMYHFWSKCEYEVIVHSLHYKPERDDEFKIDVWYQLEPNLDRITEYVIKELHVNI